MDNYFYKLMLKPLPAKPTPAFADRHPPTVKNALIFTLVLLRANYLPQRARDRGQGHHRGPRLAPGLALQTAHPLLRCSRRLRPPCRLAYGGRLDDAPPRTPPRARRDLLAHSRRIGPSAGPVHLLVLCVIYDGVAVPILWDDLAKKGASSLPERKALFDRALTRYDLRGMCLLADREYVGPDWFNCLAANGLDFCIRSRDHAYFRDVEAGGTLLTRFRETVAKIRASRKRNRARAFACRLAPDGSQLYFVIARAPDPRARERVMYLVTTKKESAYVSVKRYLKRWTIEHAFCQMKSNGFDLERVNLVTAKRRRLLIAAVVLAYTIAVTKGYGPTMRSYRRSPTGEVAARIARSRSSGTASTGSVVTRPTSSDSVST